MAFIGENGKDLPFPIIADEKRELATKLGMLDPDEKDSKGMPLSCRAVSYTYHCLQILGKFTCIQPFFNSL